MDFVKYMYIWFILLNVWPYCLSLGNWNSWWNPMCHSQECCIEKWIKYDETQLRKELNKRIVGQPLIDTVISALSVHFNSDSPPTKPLTLSFNGPTGSGKSYVTNFIVDSIFKQGSKSKYVHYFNGGMDFPMKTKWKQYGLFAKVKNHMYDCPRSLFIFDGVDQMAPQLLESIKPLIDTKTSQEGVDNTQAVFLFISNTGSFLIKKKYRNYINQGGKRGQITYKDFETIVEKGGFTEEGLNQNDNTKPDLIDHYIPFLPMDSETVYLCIIKEFRKRKINTPKKKDVQDILRKLEWEKKDDLSISKSGCKKIALKVEFIIAAFYAHYFTEEQHYSEL